MEDTNTTPASDDNNQGATVTPSVETNKEEISTEGTEETAQPTEETAQPTEETAHPTKETSGDAGTTN